MNIASLAECQLKCIDRKQSARAMAAIGAIISNGNNTNVVEAVACKVAIYIHTNAFIIDVGVKPVGKMEMKRHEFLIEDSDTYLKSDDQWLDYGECVGFRYNISGHLTILNSYMCLMESNGQCITEVCVYG